jgi:hypothetical protein
MNSPRRIVRSRRSRAAAAPKRRVTPPALNAGWDRALLGIELGELKLGGFDLALTGFGELELGDLLADRTQGLTDPDDAPEAPEHPVSRRGDLWLLGRHRLLCGDSTVATDVERVLGGVVPAREGKFGPRMRKIPGPLPRLKSRILRQA